MPKQHQLLLCLIETVSTWNICIVPCIYHNRGVKAWQEQFVLSLMTLAAISWSTYHHLNKSYAYCPEFLLSSYQCLCYCKISKLTMACHPCWHVHETVQTTSLMELEENRQESIVQHQEHTQTACMQIHTTLKAHTLW